MYIASGIDRIMSARWHVYMGICLEKSKFCLFPVPTLYRSKKTAGFFLSADKGHTHAGHNISYAPHPNFVCYGCRCVQKVVKIVCRRLTLLTVSHVS